MLRDMNLIAVALVGILVLDSMNVFFIGGPSLSSLVLRQPGDLIVTPSGEISPGGYSSAFADSNLPVTSTMPDNATGSTDLPTGLLQENASSVTLLLSPPRSYVTAESPVLPVSDGLPELRYILPADEEISPEPYVTIYSANLSCNLDPTAVGFNLVNPPMVINFTVIPMNITDRKLITYQYSGKRKGLEEIVNITRPNEDSWFTITIYERESRAKLEEYGYGGLFGKVASQTIVLRRAGDYLIQFDGLFATAEVDIRVKSAENL